MTRDDLDRLLAEDDTLRPSSGFAASVMDAIRSDASAPRPIPFPWLRALPALLSLLVAFAVALSSIELTAPALPRALPDLAANPANAAVVVAALTTIASLAVVLRLVRRV